MGKGIHFRVTNNRHFTCYDLPLDDAAWMRMNIAAALLDVPRAHHVLLRRLSAQPSIAVAISLGLQRKVVVFHAPYQNRKGREHPQPVITAGNVPHLVIWSELWKAPRPLKLFSSLLPNQLVMHIQQALTIYLAKQQNKEAIAFVWDSISG